MDVGFIGVGAMGSRMVRNLLRAGHTVTAWDRSAAALEAVAAEGARAAASARGTLAGDAVITMVTNDDAVRDVFLAGGLLADAKPGLVHVAMASISVAFAQELAAAHAAAGVAFVSAPVFGRPELAASAQLNIVAAGPAAAIDRVQPLLDVLGKRTWRLGEEPFRANLVKIGYNLMLAAAVESMAEAAALGQAYGIDPGELLEVYTGTGFACLAHQSYAEIIAERAYEPAGFSTRLMLKDVRMALAAADAVNVALPQVSVARDVLLEAVAAGHGDKDWSVLADIALRRAGQTPAG